MANLIFDYDGILIKNEHFDKLRFMKLSTIHASFGSFYYAIKEIEGNWYKIPYLE